MKKFKHFTISDLALGTWKMGGGFWTPSYENDEKDVSAIKKAIELGITTIDTAEMYGGGHAEELVGKAIKDFKRDDVFIITKVWPNHAKYDDVIKSAKASSSRLGTFIDLYLLHWPSSSVPICETMSAFEKLVEDGIVKFIGLSNFKPEGIQKANECLKKNEITAIENHYSLLDRSDEDTLEYAKKNGIAYFSYTPLEKGRISEIKILDKIAKKYNKTPIQVALNWYISIDVMVPIVKASNIKHLEENAGAMGWKLSKEDWEAIAKARD
ncbi:aldo/keto reductase [Acidianus infernus]|uniref:Aldo/keto reductase n=1 Tax=Acidianus infernus TaxID=12915 RepID=A0A6A9QKI9_ACIIN|nr:aldo/keto reductase [Acidianus infernus]MUM65746.1 aldo/keto reductase [Acidianus infernus]